MKFPICLHFNLPPYFVVFIGLTCFFYSSFLHLFGLMEYFFKVTLIFLSASLEMFTPFLFTWWLSEKLLYVYLIYQSLKLTDIFHFLLIVSEP